MVFQKLLYYKVLGLLTGVQVGGAAMKIWAIIEQ